MAFRLKAIESAKANSIRRAAREYDVDESCVRRWLRDEKKIKETLQVKGKRSVRTHEKKHGRHIDTDFETELVGWMAFEREAQHSVSRKALVEKALSIGREDFKASLGWLEKFIQRNCCDRGAHESTADRLPKLAAFVAFVEQVRRTESILPANIVTMDETAVCLDSACVTVCLSATGNGTKLKPLIVFKDAGSDVLTLAAEFRGQVHVLCTKSGWMDQEATLEYLNCTFGHGSYKTLLVWDSFRCHTTSLTKKALAQRKIIPAIIPADCTEEIQVADVALNRPFKQHIADLYSKWTAEYSPRDSPRVPSPRQLVQWIIAAWAQITDQMVREAHRT